MANLLLGYFNLGHPVDGRFFRANVIISSWMPVTWTSWWGIRCNCKHAEWL